MFQEAYGATSSPTRTLLHGALSAGARRVAEAYDAM